MKKFLPIILFVLGLVVLVLVYFFVIKSPKKTNLIEDDTTSLIEVSLNDRPIVSLTPTSDGHWLNLKIEKIKIPGAYSMDYELLYDLPDGRTQGVPGSITLNGQTLIERELLLGSESSGKFRYDEGVEIGTMTVRFRNEKGKLIARFTTKFALLSNTKELVSVDEAFTATLSKSAKGYFVVMETFGIPKDAPSDVKSGPYGLFYSEETTLSGEAQLGTYTTYMYKGTDWAKDSFDSGIFIGLEE
ncbi:hypothetical protein KJ570_03480 [Patescibacteria group bacterium]|nr:hypothetical protein [Patescibacteria group bacterium]MBU2036041.1 hypothetical protein [Patescibacteria group bacterium]